MKRFIARTLAFIASLLIIFALLFTSLQYVVSDEDWFRDKYDELRLEERIGIPTSDITAAFMQLIKYMEGSEGGIDIDVSENGRLVSMYNDRERAHMVDVKALYQTFDAVRGYGLIAAAVLIIFVIALSRRNTMRTLGEGFIAASWVLLVVLLAAGAWVLIDFNSFWTAFHRLFFTYDLWLLDPATSRMIRICPLELFYGIVIRFALLFLIPMAVLALLSAMFKRMGKRREEREAREALEDDDE